MKRFSAILNAQALIVLAAGTLLALPLSACKREAPKPAAVTADPGATLVLSGARLVLPAVSGNPGAVYLTIANAGVAPVTVTGLAVAGARRVEMHETKGMEMLPLKSFAVDPGNAVALEPGGKHAMVFGIPASLKQGQSVAVTVERADGDSATIDAQVEAPGSGGMETMPQMDQGH